MSTSSERCSRFTARQLDANEGAKERRNENDGTSDVSLLQWCDYYSISAKNSIVLLSASMNASTSSGRL